MSRSVFNYIQPGELPDYIHTMSSVTNSGTAAKFISDAERIVDGYAGPGPRFYSELTGRLSAAIASGATSLTADVFGTRRPNYWAKGGVYVEVVSSSESSVIGERRLVVSSSGATLTLASGFGAAVPSGSEITFKQESVFPRLRDQDQFGTPRLPEQLKAIVAAQVEYAFQLGSEAFGLSDPDVVTDREGDVVSRTYGSGYSESRDARRKDGLAVWIAPRARALMRRLTNATGWLRG